MSSALLLRGAPLACLAGAVLATALLLAVPAGAATFTVRELAPGVFVHEGRALPLDAPGHDDIANIGFIIGTRCVAVIDSGGSVRIGQALRESVRRHTHLPVCYVINTHVHVDHLLGNYAFAPERPQFTGHTQLPAALVRSREFFLANYAADLAPPASASQLIGPTRTVEIGSDVEVDLGGRHLTLRAWPVAHTDCDLSVYDSRSGTLWTGDLLFVERTPVLDGSLKGWLVALEGLASLSARHVVPGHGPAGNDLQRALEPQRRYLQALLDTVRGEISRGVTLPQALRAADFPERGGWLLWDETHPRNVARAYQELEWE
jgi:quinoprotein relay system zinc metallohydrolase 2